MQVDDSAERGRSRFECVDGDIKSRYEKREGT